MNATYPGEVTLQELATKTSDAYSYDRYGERGWMACCRMLARRGYNLKEIETILRSKWMRWAADSANEVSDNPNSADLALFLDDPRNKCTPAEVTRLVEETFS